MQYSKYSGKLDLVLHTKINWYPSHFKLRWHFRVKALNTETIAKN